jgi:3'(2'), 5'-bisphosphate nucleotidase
MLENGATGGLDLAPLIALAREAGTATLQFFRRECAVEWKGENDPLTAADRISHDIIVAGLQGLTPDLPIISEEGDLPPYSARANWPRFWLIDPLDGTKEFLKGTTEFTINIALIEGTHPVLGIVYAPAQDLLYAGGRGRGSWKQQGRQAPQRIQSRSWQPGRPARVVESRSHPSAALEAYLQSIDVAERVQTGSSLKFCVVAEGAADLYPRFGPMMEWDAAAGDCIYRYSTSGEPRWSPITYNQPDLRINGFIIGCEAMASAPAIIG